MGDLGFLTIPSGGGGGVTVQGKGTCGLRICDNMVKLLSRCPVLLKESTKERTRPDNMVSGGSFRIQGAACCWTASQACFGSGGNPSECGMQLKTQTTGCSPAKGLLPNHL